MSNRSVSPKRCLFDGVVFNQLVHRIVHQGRISLDAYAYLFRIITQWNFEPASFISALAKWFRQYYENNPSWIRIVHHALSYFDRQRYVHPGFDQMNHWRFQQILPLTLAKYQRPALINPEWLLTYLILGLTLPWPCLEALAYSQPGLL